MIMTFKGKVPVISPKSFVAENATVIGDVKIGADCGILFGAVVRADDNIIKIGDRTNVQDMTVIHCQSQYDTIIGDDVTIGHRAIIHGCRIGNRCLIGMGAIIMNGVEIGEDCIIGAGALVTEGQKIPKGMLVVGFPAKPKREITEEEKKLILRSSAHYAERAGDYRLS